MKNIWSFEYFWSPGSFGSSFPDISVLIKDIISDLAIKDVSKDFSVLIFKKFLFFELFRST